VRRRTRLPARSSLPARSRLPLRSRLPARPRFLGGPRRPWREWTLRSRMVVAIATLAAIGIVVTDLAGVLLLRDQLIHRIDDQLNREARAPARTTFNRNGYALRRGPFGPDARILEYDAAGNPIGTPAADDPGLGGFASLKSHAGTGPYTVDGWRVLVTYLPDTRPGAGYAVGAVSLTEVQSTEEELLLIDVPVSALVLALIGLAAATVVRIGLRPLTRMEHTATEIAGGDLSSRVDDADPHTESGRLGTALNGMLGQIESALAARTASEQRLRQFLADASHELRTPLTSIQGFAELYRRGGAPPGPALDEAMGRIESEAARMALLVSDLMLLARLDQERPLDRHPVDLLAIAMDAVRDAHARVPDRFVRLDPPVEPPMVHGDESRLRQVVTNLIANALQHTPADASITVRLDTVRPDDGAPTAAVGDEPAPGTPLIVLEVVDTGPGLAADEAARVFERLYRVDRSRSRGTGAIPTAATPTGATPTAATPTAAATPTGGAGLGLAIVAAIVTAHGGRAELRTAPRAGAGFRVLLPAHARPPARRHPVAAHGVAPPSATPTPQPPPQRADW
jgi:two-component system OmpR family sensor kinase